MFKNRNKKDDFTKTILDDSEAQVILIVNTTTPFSLLLSYQKELFEVKFNEKDERNWNFPWLSLSLCLGLSSVSLIRFGKDAYQFRIEDFVYAYNVRFELWRILTYNFVSNSMVMLVKNLIGILTFGSILECSTKNSWKIGLLLLDCAFLFALFSSFANPRNEILGANCLVYALMGGNLSFLAVNEKLTNHALKVLLIILFMVAEISLRLLKISDQSDLGMAMIIFLASYILSPVLFNGMKKDEKWTKLFQGISIGAALSLNTLAIALLFLTPPKLNS